MQYGPRLVACFALLVLASGGETGSSSDSELDVSVAQQQRALETEAPRRDAYDADDERPPPERGFHETDKHGKWPRRRPFTGRALRPAPFYRSTSAAGLLEGGYRADTQVSHRTGIARDALQSPEEAPLDLEGLVETANQSPNKGAPATGGPHGYHPPHRGHDRVSTWSMADASDSTSDELDRACRLPIGAERRRAFSLIREKIEARRRQRLSTTWNPFTLLGSSDPRTFLDSRRINTPRHLAAPESVLLREINSERRKRRAPGRHR